MNENYNENNDLSSLIKPDTTELAENVSNIELLEDNNNIKLLEDPNNKEIVKENIEEPYTTELTEDIQKNIYKYYIYTKVIDHTTKDILVYYNINNKKYYDAITDDWLLELDSIDNDSELKEITFDEYNTHLEEAVIDLNYFFSPDLYTLALAAEDDDKHSFINSLDFLSQPFINSQDEILAKTMLELQKDDKIETCQIPKRLVFDNKDYGFNNVVKYIKTNFGYFDNITLDIPVDIDNNSDDIISNLTKDNESITSIQSSILSYIHNTNNVLEKRIELDRFIKIHYFYRSYIDLYHDILKYGDIYCKHIYDLFIKSDFFKEHPNYPYDKILYEKREFITNIDKINNKIKTSGNEINQNKCKELLEEYVDNFILKLHEYGITWIPKKKEDARVVTVNIKNECELRSLLNILRNDGINSFYVESANSSIGALLSSSKNKDKLDLSSITIGEWDAGSGFSSADIEYEIKQLRSFKKSKKGNNEENNEESNQENEIEQDGGNRKRKRKEPQYINVQNNQLDLFNLFKIIVSEDNDTLINKFNDKYIKITNGPDKLSVNAILKVLGHPPIRGTSDKKEKTIKSLNIRTDNIHKNFKISPYNAMVASLKTWTDLIQIVSISLSKSSKTSDNLNFKTAVIISDRLCETTARMYGLGHVLLNQTNIVSYYNYDINSRKFTTEEINIKLKMFKMFSHNKGKIISYVDNWLQEKIEIIEDIIKHTTDTRLYFILNLLSRSYKNQINSYKSLLDVYDNQNNITIDILKKVPNNSTILFENLTDASLILGDFQELVESFTESLKGLKDLRSRSPTIVNDFIDTYESVKQIIVNTYVKNIDIYEDADKIINAYTSICIAYKFITTGYNIDIYTTTFKTLIETIVKDDNTILCSEHELINEALNEIIHIQTIYQFPKKISDLITSIQLLHKQSITIHYLYYINNVIQAFIIGSEYINEHKNIPKHTIIFKDYIDYSEKTLIDKILVEAFDISDNSIIYINNTKNNCKNTRKQHKFSITKNKSKTKPKMDKPSLNTRRVKNTTKLQSKSLGIKSKTQKQRKSRSKSSFRSK
jgi:hypothetical protein